jgi:ATP-dependent RNA helicase RhlE
MLEVVSDLGYEEPTPVQAEAIPAVIQGRDLLAAAQTGTGKTAAFLLPVADRLGHAPRHGGPLMLVITPTRELAQQIEDVAVAVAARTHHHCVTVVGGASYEPQKAALARGCDILVATPGRLVDLIDQGVCHLGSVEVLVIDEADRMLDMGFLPSVRKIVAQVPRERQTLLLSATLDDSAIAGISDLVHDPVRVEIARKGTVAETIDQFALPVSLEAKNALLAKVLVSEGPHRVIVFTRTKHRADACCRRLRREGISCAPIHGNRSQNQREHALSDFRDGKIDVLVATDVLARGIDIAGVSYVVNFDVPADPEDYIHRIGRTGRAGEMGWALTFVTVDDVADLYAIERLMGKVVPAYQPKAELDLGAELPSLDPDRSAEARPRGGVKKGSHKHGGKGRQRSTATAESTGAAKATPKTPAKAHETSHQPSKAAGNKDRGKAGKARRPKRQSSPRNDRRGQDEDLPPQKPFSGPRKYKRHPGDRGGQ